MIFSNDQGVHNYENVEISKNRRIGGPLTKRYEFMIDENAIELSANIISRE